MQPWHFPKQLKNPTDPKLVSSNLFKLFSFIYYVFKKTYDLLSYVENKNIYL